MLSMGHHLYFYNSIFVGLLVLMFLEELKQSEKDNRVNVICNNSLKLLRYRYPTVWMLIIIVLCAYCGYKSRYSIIICS